MSDDLRPAAGGLLDSYWTVNGLARLSPAERDRLRQMNEELKEMAAFGVTDDRRDYAREMLRARGLDPHLLDAFGADRGAWLAQAAKFEDLLDAADAQAVFAEAEPAAIARWAGGSLDEIGLGHDVARKLKETLDWAHTPDRWNRAIDHLMEEGVLDRSAAAALMPAFDRRGLMRAEAAQTESLLGAIGTLNKSGRMVPVTGLPIPVPARNVASASAGKNIPGSRIPAMPNAPLAGSSETTGGVADTVRQRPEVAGASTAAEEDAPTLAGATENLSNFLGQAVGVVDRTFMPEEALNQENIHEFNKMTGYTLDMHDDAVTVRDPEGRRLLELGRDDAAYLIHAWTPDLANRISALGVVERDDLSPLEKRNRLARMLLPGAGETSSSENHWEVGPDDAMLDFDPRPVVAKQRLQAFDALEAARRRGASDEEIWKLHRDLQEAMLPEILGNWRIIAELAKDIVPGLGNIRSFRHLQNDIAEVERAIETDEWSDAAVASLLLVADAVGILPGVNVLKTLGKGAVKLVPHADGLLAERRIGQLDDLAQRAREALKSTKEKVDPKRYFGDEFSDLPKTLQNSLRGLVNNRVGTAAERLLEDLGRRMDPKPVRQNSYDDLPIGNTGKKGRRIYDLSARKRSDLIREQFDPLLRSTLGRFDRWADRFGGEAFRAKQLEYEMKLNEAQLSERQDLIDNLLKNNEELAREKGIGEIKYLRMYESEIPIEFIIDDLAIFVNRWVGQRRLSQDQAASLLGALKEARRRGTPAVAMGDYVGFLARFAAAPMRELEPTGDLSMQGLHLAP